jgi:2-polyprenyl-3-methyl-5-hydroxy-6-metoxy-1,4-benzoquinol methylase
MVKLNKFGFYSLQKKPSEVKLKKYYADKYYQGNKASYKKIYLKEELEHIDNKIEQKYLLAKGSLPKGKRLKILDVGCGEGFCLSYFKKKGWEILGLDFSKFGLSAHNPHLEKYMMSGDIYHNLKTLKAGRERFDLIWLDNVLEHVLDPLKLLVDCHDLTSDTGLLIVEVPNDFSKLQAELKKLKMIKKDFWVTSPDHISYFNKEGLINICRKAGWNNKKTISDFPIDFNLFNPNSNYIENEKTGNGAHLQRVRIDNLMHRISAEKTNKYYEALADLGLGRQIIAIFKK